MPQLAQAISVPIKSVADADALLHSLVLPVPRPYAQRGTHPQRAIRELLARIGNPQDELAIVHIAGSKGKGSTALIAEALLEALGQRTATFSSPHLERWTERYRIDGREIGADQFAHGLERLRPHIAALHAQGPETTPSFFDVATAAAFELFRDAGVDYAIIETGLGGRWDATNVVEPILTCITSIELEHTDKLGDNIEGIATHKAGIIKTRVPLVLGPLPPEAAVVIEDRAIAAEAPMIRFGRDFTLDSVAAFEVNLAGGRHVTAMLDTPGMAVATNAALALACVERLIPDGDDKLAAIAPRTLSELNLPGRTELVSRDPWVIIDMAHTRASAQQLADVLNGIPSASTQLLLSMSEGKDLQAFCDLLLPLAQSVTVTRADPQRSLPAERLAAEILSIRGDADIKIQADPILAIRTASSALGPNDMLCITGSAYIAGLARGLLAASTGRS